MGNVVDEGKGLWLALDDRVQLRGVHCDQCDSELFPPQSYGCEVCGADGEHLAESLIDSEGTLHAFTTVYVHDKLETPYQVAEVKTAARQLVRGLLDHPDPHIGDAVTGTVRVIDESQKFVFVPRKVS